MWKPGQLVTIEGIVYRVKRECKPWYACCQCAFGDELCCSLSARHYGGYPLPADCYLKRESPIKREPLILKVRYE